MSDSLRAEAFAYLMQIDERGEESVSQLISQIAAEKEGEVWKLLRRLAFKEENREKEVKWLSGGELKKIYIALTFVQDAALLILDEPSLHLDQEALAVLIDLLESDPRAEILITHDPALQSVCQRHYQIKTGEVNVLEEVFHG